MARKLLGEFALSLMIFDVVPEILLCLDPVIVGADHDCRAVLWPFAAGGGVLGRGHHSVLAAVVGDEGPPAGLKLG